MTRLLDLWQPPDEAGLAVGCLATSFTFEADFFVDDCLTRFLGLTRVQGEGDTTSDVARMLDEEDRLSEAQVSVLVDRSCVPDKRNLRWDLLPVALGRGRLLHAKVAVLMWERHTRVLLGSANLTSAGYRRQIETVTAFDLTSDCGLPEPLLRSLVAELRDLLGEVPGDPATHARARAAQVLDRFGERIDEAGLPASGGRKDPRLALAVTKPNAEPLDGFDAVWTGGPPRQVTVLSPFWDVDAEARKAVVGRLAQRGPVEATFVVSVDPMTQKVRAPESLLDDLPGRVAVEAVELGSPPDATAEDRMRLLHAKCIRYESDTWTAAMVGSSNVTTAGLGLKAASHREINLWIGAPADSPVAKALCALIPEGGSIDLKLADLEPLGDEDEVALPALPTCFVDAVLHPGPPPTIELTLDVARLPDQWEVLDGDHVLADNRTWQRSGMGSALVVDISDRTLVSSLDVRWHDDGEVSRAPWPVNVSDPALLPPPEELRSLSMEVLLAVLASTRPIHDALERELRKAELAPGRAGRDELDALARFDSERMLLTRTRRMAAALWGLQRRFDRPLGSLEALDWRLSGIVGATQLADGLCGSVADGDMEPIEARFHLAELARTVGTIEWEVVASRLDPTLVRTRVAKALDHIKACANGLPAGGGAVDTYVAAALGSVTP